MILLKNIVNKSHVFVFFLLTFFVGQCFAWSKQGHYEIGNITHESLNDSAKVYMRLRLHALNSAGAKLKNFGDFSVLADELKDLPLEAVFKKYGEGVPPYFELIQKENTKTWHYQDVIINDRNSKCSIKTKGQLVSQLENIKKRLIDTNNRLSIVQEAIMWAFALHLLEDIHQPLHTMSKVNGDCESDLGGNKVCVTREGEQCKVNLHQYWDRGFGVFDEPLTLPQLDDFKLDPQAWAQEGLAYENIVYAKRNKDYELEAKPIAKNRAELAAARSVRFIETIMQFKKAGVKNTSNENVQK